MHVSMNDGTTTNEVDDQRFHSEFLSTTCELGGGSARR